MGWLCEGVPNHEGYVVGLVEETVMYKASDGTLVRSVRLRELTYAMDHDRSVPAGGLPVAAFQVACECGWRSRLFLPLHRARWTPFSLDLGDEALEDAAREEWRQHVQHERVRERAESVTLSLIPLSR